MNSNLFSVIFASQIFYRKPSISEFYTLPDACLLQTSPRNDRTTLRSKVRR